MRRRRAGPRWPRGRARTGERLPVRASTCPREQADVHGLSVRTEVGQPADLGSSPARCRASRSRGRSVARESGKRLAVSWANRPSRKCASPANVLPALAQGRDAQHEAGHAVVDVATELAPFHLAVQVRVRRGHDARVHANGRATHGLDLPALQRAQELGLQGERHVGDLVQEKGAAVGELELARTPGHTRGHAFSDPEHLGFQQLRGNRRAIDGDERPVPAGRRRVQDAGELLLADTRLAQEEHGNVPAQEHAHLFVELEDRGGAAGQVAVGKGENGGGTKWHHRDGGGRREGRDGGTHRIGSSRSEWPGRREGLRRAQRPRSGASGRPWSPPISRRARPPIRSTPPRERSGSRREGPRCCYPGK